MLVLAPCRSHHGCCAAEGEYWSVFPARESITETVLKARVLVKTFEVFLLGWLDLGLAHGLHVECEGHTGHCHAQFHVCEVLTDAANRSDAEGLEGAFGESDGVFAVFHFTTDHPALRLEGVWVRVVFRIVVNRVDGHAHVVALGNVIALDIDASSADFSPKSATHRR